MSKQNLIDSITTILADSYALYLKTQNYHWNVTGPHFYSLHALFESQYKELAEDIDSIAERIRALGAKAPASITAYNKLKKIADGNENATYQEMIQHLHADNLFLADCLKQAIALAQAEQDEASASLLSDRLLKHEKNAWMLSSML